jgi:hypothetical protein
VLFSDNRTRWLFRAEGIFCTVLIDSCPYGVVVLESEEPSNRGSNSRAGGVREIDDSRVIQERQLQEVKI